MKKDDFYTCRFIEDRMWFVDYNDFCNRRNIIKRLFKKMTPNEQLFYKWYIYSNVHMKEAFKNVIFDYLNDYTDEKRILRFKKMYKPM